ncbi:FMN-dependent NADH-azoreductase [Variovorax sp. TBS-050B]|uniref:FMN-dependent NADH-azoreductase n=1 Tax=Variovorax sp. TBS-050B TaxID=2940551 RepID=UPI002475D952|nr:NAD(P)H-dependent oxidoreductase [Variovorax sp. TBS-050B]MDH6590379.1 FMN-dependent NADH-azoreductase [Variovorax sp. TBS-050B]
MKILHIVCSPRGAESLSLRFSQRIVARLVARHPCAEVTTRDLGAVPLPHADEDYGHALAGSRPPPDDAPAHGGSLLRSDQLIAELERADTLVIGTPMHNYTVPSVLKAWLDHVIRVHRTFRLTPEGKKGLLADRPVYVAVAAGGSYTGADARQPDFLTPYLQAALGTIGLRDLRFFPLQRMVGGEARVEEALRDAQALLERQLPAGLSA